jgi:hypothetical protein
MCSAVSDLDPVSASGGPVGSQPVMCHSGPWRCERITEAAPAGPRESGDDAVSRPEVR